MLMYYEWKTFLVYKVNRLIMNINMQFQPLDKLKIWSFEELCLMHHRTDYGGTPLFMLIMSVDLNIVQLSALRQLKIGYYLSILTPAPWPGSSIANNRSAPLTILQA